MMRVRVHYESFDNIVEWVQKFGRGALMAKADIEDAFRIIPIHPEDHHLLVSASMAISLRTAAWQWLKKKVQKVQKAYYNSENVQGDIILTSDPRVGIC